MANNAQNNTSLWGWVVIIAALFFLGKTCGGGDDKPLPTTYSYLATPSHPAAWPATRTEPEPQNYKAPQPTRYRTHRRRIPASSRQLIRGPRGGCYYINDNGNKIYVDRSLCN